MELQGKVALVTGGNRGLGYAIGEKLMQHGAAVVLTGRREEETRKAAEKLGCDWVLGDVTDPRQVETMIRQVLEHHGKIDILVNNAGISREMPLMEMPLETWYEIIHTNLNSVAIVTKAVLPAMEAAGGGAIVNIASAAAIRGLPGSSAYAAAKAGVVALSQSLGDELRPKGIRVNVVCPGPIDTELFRQSERRDFILAAGGDVFDPETVAEGVLFLCSDRSRGMSSQVLTMRGFNRW